MEFNPEIQGLKNNIHDRGTRDKYLKQRITEIED